MIDLPAFHCPLPIAVRPDALEFDDRPNRWIDTCPVPVDATARARIRSTHSGAFVACASPDGVPERLEWGGRWFLIGFTVDDWIESLTTVEEAVAVGCTLQRVLETGADPARADLPFGRHFAEMIRDCRSFATDTQYSRFAAAYRAYHQGIPLEAAYRITGRTVPLAEHLSLRSWLCGAPIVCAALEIYNDMEIPGHEHDHPAVGALRESAGLLLGWANDICSLGKDIEDGGGANNLVAALMDHHDLDVSRATAEAIEVWNHTMGIVLRLRGQVAAGAGPALERFLRDLDNTIANTIQWHANNPRYGDLPPMAVVAEPPAGPGPRPAAPLEAWWQRLTSALGAEPAPAAQPVV
ncbi:hypothetical protein [Streptomyces sp. NPDC059788]|uniref:terpene synthase family protein n=1 Tax=Streptomyces sp. NPDC059788 TaxID=3346948 RepID=UPI003650E567